MSDECREQLQQICELLNEVGERLSAIDHALGDSDNHWHTIGENGVMVRGMAAQLPEQLRARLPQLMAFANSSSDIIGCWGRCYSEVKSTLE